MNNEINVFLSIFRSSILANEQSAQVKRATYLDWRPAAIEPPSLQNGNSAIGQSCVYKMGNLTVRAASRMGVHSPFRHGFWVIASSNMPPTRPSTSVFFLGGFRAGMRLLFCP